MGALANIDTIKEVVRDSLIWEFPIEHGCSGIPVGKHPGAFLTQRKHHIHTGVDLYVNDGALVHAVEAGKVVGIEHFTGPLDGSPWWNDTDCVLIEGASGVVLYGEVQACSGVKIGDKIKKGSWFATVKQVLKDHKSRPDIMGHRLSMLHMELYPHGKYTAIKENGENPDNLNILRDPTPYLITATNAPKTLLTHNI
jgi:Peptidase family M23